MNVRSSALAVRNSGGGASGSRGRAGKANSIGTSRINGLGSTTDTPLEPTEIRDVHIPIAVDVSVLANKIHSLYRPSDPSPPEP